MRYSLGRYSLPAVGTDIAITCAVSERLNCMARFGSNLLVDNKFTENIAGRAVLTLAYPEGLQAVEALTVFAAGDIAVNLGGMTASETLGCTAVVIADVFVRQIAAEELQGVCYLSADMTTTIGQMLEALDSNTSGGIDMQLQQIYSEVLGVTIDATTLTKEVILLNVTIPPGGKLVIDSDLYTAMLDDENVLHLHKGGWVWLERNLISIAVDSGTGGALTGKVIYNERYL